MMLNRFFIILIGIAFVGCGTDKVDTKDVVSNEKDSVWISEFDIDSHTGSTILGNSIDSSIVGEVIIDSSEMKKRIDQFFYSFYKSNPNDVELIEGNNEKLFMYAKEYPTIFTNTICEQTKPVQTFLLSILESPIHDLIDLQLIHSKIVDVDSDCSIKQEILDAIKIAGNKIGQEID